MQVIVVMSMAEVLVEGTPEPPPYQILPDGQVTVDADELPCLLHIWIVWPTWTLVNVKVTARVVEG